MSRAVRTAGATCAVLLLAVLAPVSAGAATSAPRTSAPSPAPMTAITEADRAALGHLVAATVQPPVRRLIVHTTNGRVATSAITSAASSLASVSSTRVVRRLASGSTLVALSTPLPVAEAWKVARELTARGDVAYAEPDLLMRPLGTPSPVVPNDPDFSAQWDLWDSSSAATSGGGWSIHAPTAWKRTTGRPQVVVAVLDTGITAHPDLAGQTVPGYDFVSGDGANGYGPFYTANDGDGRDPDPADPGDWITPAEAAGTGPEGTFFSDANCQADSSSWHGTHVAGTIAARMGNGTGITGIAPDVKIQPIRVLGKCGGYTSDIADAIRWAAGAPSVATQALPATPNPTPATVLNLSLGAPVACDAETQGAITAAVAAGATVVVAAGNDRSTNTTTTGSNPANCTGVVEVVATDRAGHLASYSNTGIVAGTTAIAAPGGGNSGDPSGDILSTVNLGSTSPTAPGYAAYAGTSMATPHVAAAAALLQSLAVGRAPITPAQMAVNLASLTRAFPAGSGCSTATCGPGILDLGKALPTFAPLAPTDLVTQPGHSFVTLSWSPGDPGGASTVTYTVESSIDGTTFTPAGTTTATSQRVSGLVDGTPYWFRVTATTTDGTSPPSAVVGPVQPAAHTRPQWVHASVTSGVERLGISWSKLVSPDDGGDPVTHYSVEYRLAGSATWSCAVPSTPADPECLVGAATTSVTIGWPRVLTAGTYEVRVAAKNDVSGIGLYGPTTAIGVRALHQTGAVSATTVRPLRDGFQDSIRLVATSNSPTTGVVRILDSRLRPVRTLNLATGTSWVMTWAGTTDRGARVANGRYRVRFYLRGRTSALQVVADPVVTVASSRATKPVITLSASTVFPYKDGYLDTITMTATATVPSTWSWRIVGPRGTVWSHTFTRRGIARTSWAGTTTAHVALPAGSYTLVTTAKGGEGPAVSNHRSVGISTKRVKSNPFDFTITAMNAPTYLLFGNASQVDADSIALDPQALIGVSLRLPSSVRPYSDIRVITCSDYTNTVDARARFAFLDRGAAIAQGPWGIPNAKGCYITPAAAPALSLFAQSVNFAVANVPLAGKTDVWIVSAYEVTGTTYFLA